MEPISYFLDGLKTGKNGYNQSSASDANVHTFAQNGQFHYALKLPVLLVEAAAPNPENAEKFLRPTLRNGAFLL